jgi:hypothetical protein
MYEVYLKNSDGREIFVGFFRSIFEIDNLKKDYPDKEFVIYKVIGDFGEI